MPYTIHEIAELAGVSLRTLRHYDALGLLKPAQRSEAGYRLYTEAELSHLQQVLFFRELDFPLKKIREILLDPRFDQTEALEMQIGFLDGRAKRYAALADLAKKTLKSMKEGKQMDKQEMFKGFDYDKMMAEQAQYEDEVKARWGNTDAYKISRERTAKLSKEDWARLSARQEEDLQELTAAYKAGLAPDDPRTQAAVKKMHQFIDENFYPCSAEMMGCLGQMYTADERFARYYDSRAEGLAQYYSEAIRIYTTRAGE